MKVGFFSTKPYDKESFESARFSQPGLPLEFHFFDNELNEKSAILARDCDAVCCFVNDDLKEATLAKLTASGSVKMIALRCAGFNNLDIAAAKRLGIQCITRVPRYSPYAVAEHAVGLLLSLDRKIHKAYNRTRDQNFEINGLLGFDLHGKTVGVLGTGKIGEIFCRIMKQGFQCEVLAFDPYKNKAVEEMGIPYVTKEELLKRSDIVSLHCDLNQSTWHLLDEKAFDMMKQGAVIINVSRGGLIDTKALIAGLKCNKLGGCAIDVYEYEEGIFHEDLSQKVITDDIISRLLSFPNTLVTSHQAWFTKEALGNISASVIESLTKYANGQVDQIDKSALL